MFELFRFGCGGAAPCRFECGGRNSCRSVSAGDLEDAIRRARDLMGDDPLNVVEVRSNGETLCTVGYGWVSRRRPRSTGKARPS